MAVTVYFEHGQVVKMLPTPSCSYYEARDQINRATFIVSDGIKHDLSDPISIHSIQIPEYLDINNNPISAELGATGYLEYVLRMHSGLLWNEGEYNLSISCLRQACLLMLYSPLIWKKKDYYRIVNSFIELGRFKKAKEWEDWIERHVPSVEDFALDAFRRTLDSCKFLGTDLVEVGDLNACCAICATYRKRIYSLSGADKRFPKFPKDFHFQCGLNISAFCDGISEPAFKCKNYVFYSKRPFVDDRTPEEKENYQDRLRMIAETQYGKRSADINRIIYYWFRPKFPNDFPKSLSGFSRMRNSNSEKYRKLIQKIEAAGYEIPKSLDDVARWDEEHS